jgi:acetyl esterase/lipase
MSWRMRILLWLSRTFAKRQLAGVPDPLPLRPMFDIQARWIFRLPPYTLIRRIALAPQLPAIVVSNRPGSHPVRSRKVLLYLHGGAFIVGRPENFAGLMARLSRLTRTEVVAPDYRLAPEHPFPAAVEDARAAWAGLIARGYAPADIVIGGDSAGGNLALGLLAKLLGEGARPAGLFAFSPVCDLTFAGPSIALNATTDAILPAERRDELMGYYLGGASPGDPRASPLMAEFTNPPPVFLQFAETEILADDSRRMAAKLRAAGGEVTLDVWPDAPHVWVLFDGYVPEARAALLRVAGFVNALFGDGQTGASTPETR